MTDPNFVSALCVLRRYWRRYQLATDPVSVSTSALASRTFFSPLLGISSASRYLAFLQAGDHVHLGPGVTGTRLTDPAFPIEELPPIDVVVLSHFHAGDYYSSLYIDVRS